jgi:endonuclease/exonuclease/phosphatase family metal-dependent hydrolase
MRTCVPGLNGRLLTRALMSVLALAGGASIAAAQTTVTLSTPTSQVVSATIRGGSYAGTNDQWTLETRASDNLEYNRRALLKFDTENTIPAGSVVTSALMTVTVKDGSEDASRSIGAYQTTLSWTETEVTWTQRRSGDAWQTAGGDFGSKLDDAVVSNKAGTKITFDVTPLVKAAVNGDLGSSRYSRIALVDLEGSTSESYREYVAPNDPDAASRPVLTVVYGGAPPKSTPPPPPPPPVSGSSTTLRVLQWNTHHGGIGSDGVWSPERIVSWIAKFNPDVISLNEIEMKDSYTKNTDEPATLAALMKQYTGKTWYYKFQTLSGDATGIGCMILSRFPLDASGPLLMDGGRSAINVTIAVNGRTINFSSTHLHPDSAAYRKTEIGELTKWQTGLPEQRIIAGDFNATYTSSENATMKQTYSDSWAVAQADGTDVAYAGNTAGNTRNGRIDFIYYSQDAKDLALKSSQVYDTRDSNGVTPSDHKPLMSVFTVK